MPITPNIDNYTTFLFDLDGTLIDSNPVIIEAWQRQAKQYNIIFSQSDIDHHIRGVSAEHTLSHLFGSFTANQQEEIHRRVDEFEEKAPTQLIDGAKDFLLYLKAKGYNIGLVTGSWRAKISNVISDHGLNLFTHIVCRSDITQGKPHPEPYLKALTLFNASASESLAFEDSIGGISSAKAAGLSCIAVNQPFYPDLHNISSYYQLLKPLL